MKTLFATTALVSARAFAGVAAPRVEPVLTGAATLTMPTRASKRGSESKYPFASLTAVGMAFGVTNKTAANLSSIVSNANRKMVKPVLGDDGKATFATKEIKDADGNTTTVPDTSKPITAPTAHYFAFDVTPEYRTQNKEAFAKDGTFAGATVLVFRDK